MIILQKNVTTSGTPVPLASDTAVNLGMPLIIKAKTGNTGAIYVGDSSAHALHSGTDFFKLDPGEVLKVKVENLNKIYIDSDVNGEGVECISDADFIPKVTTYPLGWGEDPTTQVQRIEGYLYTRTRVTADTLIRTGAAYIKGILFTPLVAVPTAGLATVYDNTAESGTVVHAEWNKATDGSRYVPIESLVATGIYVGFDAALANFAVTVIWRTA